VALVRLTPLGETIETRPGETVLDAAFRQGFNLAHGCREGQCSACKCQVLAGEVDLHPYSSFALSDAEREAGYALMCRAIPEGDVEIELLHFDPDTARLEHPIREGAATVRALRRLTEDIIGLTLRVADPPGFTWRPGQFIDLHVPGSGHPSARRSFSIANRPSAEPPRELELFIRRYPGGRLSGMLGESIRVGTRLGFTGPYGTFGLRPSSRPVLLVAGGSGLGPVLALLRELVVVGCERPVRLWFGARRESELFCQAEIAALGERLADFRFIPVVGRFVHEAIDEELSDPDVYMCGPPPMLEAVEALMVRRGVRPEQIVQDRFTSSAQAPGAATPGPNGSPDAELGGGSPEAELGEPRHFAWFAPAARRATLYEDVTVDTQPSIHRHLTRGWPLSFPDGRGTWNAASTAARSSDWFAFRDPGRLWERPFYQRSAALEQGLEATVRSAAEQGLLEDLNPAWREILRGRLQIPAFVEHGLWFALATAARDCLSDSVATCVCLQAAAKQRSAQALVLYAMDLESHLGLGLPIEPARQAFLTHCAWQPTRSYLERLAATWDWMELIVAANLVFEPIIGTLLRRELGTRAAAANRDTVTPAIAAAASREWSWTRAWSVALVRFLVADPVHGAANRALVTGWLQAWHPRADDALDSLLERSGIPGLDAARCAAAVRADADEMAAEALSATEATEPMPGAAAAVPAGRGAGTPAAPGAADPAPRRGDHVGIVMAKSAEGDAVARLFSGRPGRVEVIEQAAFWEIRAPHRLVISYAEVSDRLGYDIDAYSIQHEMSTHYGRMVATDEALMLFSDPAEAMEHLLT
jgi:ferredoxin-NADP reductase/ferredoxin